MSNVRRPRLLDLFSRKGGAGVGYHRAGFEVVGVDIENHGDGYPFEFHQADAIEFVTAHGREFHAIHASPPCQADCTLTAGTNANSRGGRYRNLLAPTRDALAATGRPFVIEQPYPSRAVMRRDVLLCGLQFDLRVFRHRQFELNGWTMVNPPHPSHRGHRVAGWRHGVKYEGDMVAVYGDGGGKGSVADWQRAMGIDWMTERLDLAEAIPPAYTESIGSALADHLSGVTSRAAA